jgi:hypothetical protein
MYLVGTDFSEKRVTFIVRVTADVVSPHPDDGDDTFLRNAGS